MKKLETILLLALFTISCTNTTVKEQNEEQQDSILVRNEATEQLYTNLKKMSSNEKIMFGMANPTTIGYLNKQNDDINQSDAKDIAGSHPAFHESDFMWYEENPEFMVYDLKAMKEAYKRGAVCGYCWHFRGKESDSFYAKKEGEFTADKDLVKNILASAERQNNASLDWFLSKIDTELIPVFKELGFPIVFRPFHEMNGGWFWWGSENCTPQEYQQLFKLTVDYLREKKVDNLLLAWSLNIDEKVKWEYYPGDNYVDVLGLDCYEPGISEWSSEEIYVQHLEELTDYAAKTNKIAALTETGLRNTDDGTIRFPNEYPNFWTNYVLKPILESEKAKRIVWIMSWYGANWNDDLKKEAYIPYKGMERPNSAQAIDDFKKLRETEQVLFEDDLPNMYTQWVK